MRDPHLLHYMGMTMYRWPLLSWFLIGELMDVAEAMASGEYWKDDRGQFAEVSAHHAEPSFWE